MFLTYEVAEAETVVVVDACLTPMIAILGRDENDTERGARTVDGLCSSVFQYRDIVYVLGIYIVNCTLYAIDKDEW